MAFIVDQDVLWLEIPMADSFLVAIGECLNNLPDIVLGFLFSESLIFAEEPRETLLSAVVHEQLQFLLVLHDMKETNNVGVVQSFQMFDLSFNTIKSVPLHSIHFLVGLHGVVAAGLLVDGQRHRREAALPNVRHHLVVVKHARVRQVLSKQVVFGAGILASGPKHFFLGLGGESDLLDGLGEGGAA